MKARIYRIAAGTAALLFLLAAWLLYRGDFWSLATEDRQVEAIRAYGSADVTDNPLKAVLHPVVLFDETIQGRRILVFTDSEIDGLLGNIQFRRGIFGGWQPLCADYGAGAVLQSAVLQDRDVRVVYAAACPPEIAHYKVQANPDNDATLMAEADVTEPAFFHIHQTDRNYFPSIHLYGKAGEPLDHRTYLSSNADFPSPSIGSAEINLVYWFCAGILGVGWLIAKHLWDLSKKETA